MDTRKRLAIAALTLAAVTAVSFGVAHLPVGRPDDAPGNANNAGALAEDHAASVCAQRTAANAVEFSVGIPCARGESGSVDRSLTLSKSRDDGVLVITGADL